MQTSTWKHLTYCFIIDLAVWFCPFSKLNNPLDGKTSSKIHNKAAADWARAAAFRLFVLQRWSLFVSFKLENYEWRGEIEHLWADVSFRPRRCQRRSVGEPLLPAVCGLVGLCTSARVFVCVCAQTAVAFRISAPVSRGFVSDSYTLVWSV